MSAMAKVTPIIATVKNASVKEKTLKKTDAVPKASILDFCEEHYEDILLIIFDRARHDKRKEVQTRLNFEESPKKVRRERENSVNSRAGNSPIRFHHERSRTRGRERHDNRNVFNRLNHRKKSVHERLSDTYSPSITKFGPSGASSRDPSHSRGRSLSRDRHRIRDRLRGIEESYDDTYSSHGTGTKCRDRSRDRNHSRSVKRWRKSKSPPPRRSKSSISDRGHWKSRAKRRKPTDEEDLFVPWTCEDVDLFTPRIRNFKRHSTDECVQLRKQIEELVKAGKLSHFIKEIRQDRDQQKTRKKDAPVKDKAAAIYMIRSWQRVTQQKVTQSFARVKEIMFPPLTTNNGIEGQLVIEAEIGGHAVHRIYVDGGSSKEVLYEHYFNRLQPEIKSQMVPSTKSLTGFSGKTIWPLGQLRLLVTIRDAKHYTKAWMNFMIVRSPSPYNGIIGIPEIREFQVVPSMAHGMLKFLVNGRILTIRSTILTPTECATIAATPKDSAKKAEARHKYFKLAIHPDFLDQQITIEGTTEKRGQALKHAKAIQVEVQKLVEAGILRELYYHDWLSNPVMVRKHDGSWRMCVDFTDLIKAYSQGCYPLPEIDWKIEYLCGYPFKCFLDAYKGYHQIRMAEQDEKKMAFHTSHEVYCYTKMPFGLKNDGATYQRLVAKSFDRKIGRNLKIYVDDLVIKSHTETELLRDIEETFRTLRKINMKLNPKKCTFGAAEGMFLGYMISLEGIKPAISAVLMTKKDTVQTPMSISYFQAHLIVVITDQPIKQILADFLVEKPDDAPPETLMIETSQEPWTLFTDRSSCVDGSGDGLMLTSLEGTEFTYALRFQFTASNNEAEYEALIPGLQIAAQIGVHNVYVSVDSKLVANQVLGIYVSKEENMMKCPFLKPWLRCVGPLQEDYIIREIHEGSCSMHAGPRSVVAKAMWSGYYWPTMHRDARKMIRKCKDCQIHRPVPRHPQQPLTPITALQVKKFVWDNIVCRFGFFGEIVSDNDVVHNDEVLRLNLDLLEERRERAAIREAKAKLKMTKYYNARVRGVTFKPGDFVYRSNDASHAVDGGKLGPK
nr:reverse transcriptase domain-containing protein [Tanacetum cinerariifolium]